jgi:hypothetical protein
VFAFDLFVFVLDLFVFKWSHGIEMEMGKAAEVCGGLGEMDMVRGDGQTKRPNTNAPSLVIDLFAFDRPCGIQTEVGEEMDIVGTSFAKNGWVEDVVVVE